MPHIVDQEVVEKLSAHHQKLTELRASFPSMSEIQLQLSESQAQLEKAMARKDFNQCANLNAKIEILETQKKDPNNSIGNRLSILQIQNRITEVQQAIESGLRDKAFDTCSVLPKSSSSCSQN